MDLWIRSQDKKYLIKCDRLYINKSDNGIKKSYKIKIDFTDLGIYETEKRALEVLDEIQNILNLKDMYKYDRESVLKSWENVDEEQVKIVRQQMSVYEMPEK